MAIAPKMEVNAAKKSLTDNESTRRRRFDPSFSIFVLLAAGVLVAYGLLIVYTATRVDTDYSFFRQLVGVAIGLILLGVFWRVDYHKFANFMFQLLVLDAILIVSPLIPGLGVTVNGARSWIQIAGFQFQPGEPAKIVTILYMAAIVSRYQGRINSLSEYSKVLGLVLIPVVLILLQPDLGTGMVFFIIGMTVMFVGGANRKWIIVTVIAIALLVVFALSIDGWLDQLAGQDVFIKDYQKNRLLVFIDPSIDPTGAGYNLNQAQIAIGSGGVFGQGLFNATQLNLGYLPEAATDFIFCVLAEELGFAGAVVLVLLYALLLFATLYVALGAKDFTGTLIISGIMGMWVFQICENIGMCIGLAPITGIPLPFFSYGTSFMLTNFMALGLICSVWSYRDPHSEHHRLFNLHPWRALHRHWSKSQLESAPGGRSV
ncbi:MAG: rod shape-determining protein RodA [Coriobacteriales bacterium]|jgi:rod shape determining protein RodA|nr:rod shape-determining protein RodA [Coriobacteriales bacterium]